MSELSSVEAGARRLVPALTLAAAGLLDLVPWSGGLGTLPSPSLLLVTVAFWALERPELVPPWLLFGLGLAFDLIAFTPPGVMPLTLVAVALVLRSARQEIRAQAPLVRWLSAGLAVMLGLLLRHGLMALWRGAWFPLVPTLLDGVISVAAFLPMAWLLAATRPALPRVARLPG
jgi:rod shape-determining protein MreD